MTMYARLLYVRVCHYCFVVLCFRSSVTYTQIRYGCKRPGFGAYRLIVFEVQIDEVQESEVHFYEEIRDSSERAGRYHTSMFTGISFSPGKRCLVPQK